jgi:hypothetical protein
MTVPDKRRTFQGSAFFIVRIGPLSWNCRAPPNCRLSLRQADSQAWVNPPPSAKLPVWPLKPWPSFANQRLRETEPAPYPELLPARAGQRFGCGHAANPQFPVIFPSRGQASKPSPPGREKVFPAPAEGSILASWSAAFVPNFGAFTTIFSV